MKYIINHHKTRRRQTTREDKLQIMLFEKLNIAGELALSESKCTEFLFKCLLDSPEITSYLL